MGDTLVGQKKPFAVAAFGSKVAALLCGLVHSDVAAAANDGGAEVEECTFVVVVVVVVGNLCCCCFFPRTSFSVLVLALEHSPRVVVHLVASLTMMVFLA